MVLKACIFQSNRKNKSNPFWAEQCAAAFLCVSTPHPSLLFSIWQAAAFFHWSGESYWKLKIKTHFTHDYSHHVRTTAWRGAQLCGTCLQMNWKHSLHVFNPSEYTVAQTQQLRLRNSNSDDWLQGKLRWDTSVKSHSPKRLWWPEFIHK